MNCLIDLKTLSDDHPTRHPTGYTTSGRIYPTIHPTKSINQTDLQTITQSISEMPKNKPLQDCQRPLDELLPEAKITKLSELSTHDSLLRIWLHLFLWNPYSFSQPIENFSIFLRIGTWELSSDSFGETAQSVRQITLAEKPLHKTRNTFLVIGMSAH